MFKGSFTSNLPLYNITIFHPRVSPYSFDLLSYITFLCHFSVDDGGNIMALLSFNNRFTSFTFYQMIPRMLDFDSFVHIHWNVLG
jgi:hypothetical protein